MKTLREKLLWFLDLMPYLSATVSTPLIIGIILMRHFHQPIEQRMIIGAIVSGIIFVISTYINMKITDKKENTRK